MKPVFGLSLRSAGAAVVPPPEFCRMLELPGEVLDDASVGEWSRMCVAHDLEWGVRDLLDPGLSRRLAEENDTLCLEAFRKLEMRLVCAAANRAGWASLDLDVGRAAGNAEYAARLRRMLLQLGGLSSRIPGAPTLLLPVRIPAPGHAAEPEKLLEFRHALPFPGVRLVFELHPHEPGALEWGGGEMLRFDARFWRICFDPASGNKLPAGALSGFLDIGEEAPEALRVLFSPERSEIDDFVLKQLAETAEKWEQGK